MKHILFALAVFLLLAAPIAARAETSIAVVDIQQILSGADAAMSVEKQISDYKVKFLDELSKQERELRENEKSLSEKRTALSKQDFATQAKLLEEKFVQTGKLTQLKKKTLEKASTAALEQLRGKAYETVQVIAAEKEYTLVISKQNVIVGAQSLDITEETMRRLNEALPDIQLDFSEATPEQE